MAGCVQSLISTPEVVLNDIPFAVVNDSVELVHGKGTRQVEGASLGGTNCQIVSKDVTEAFGMLKFSVHTTLDNHKILLSLLSDDFIAKITVTVTGTDAITGATLTLSSDQCTITNNPTVKFGTGGQFDIEIKGREFK